MIKLILFIVVMAIVAFYMIRRLILNSLMTPQDKEFIKEIKEEAANLKDPEDQDLMVYLLDFSTKTKIGFQALRAETIFVVSERLESEEAIKLAQKIADYNLEPVEDGH